MATSCEELTHWKRLCCWEGLGAGEEGDDRGWDGWMTSLAQWTWVWVNSGSWWWTGRPGVLRYMGSQRVGHDWATELNWRLIKEYNQKLKQLNLAKIPRVGFTVWWTLLQTRFCRSVVSNSFWPYGLQHTSLPCPPLSPRVCSNSHLLNQWCYPTISFSVAPFSSCPQSFSSPLTYINSFTLKLPLGGDITALLILQTRNLSQSQVKSFPKVI